MRLRLAARPAGAAFAPAGDRRVDAWERLGAAPLPDLPRFRLTAPLYRRPFAEAAPFLESANPVVLRKVLYLRQLQSFHDRGHIPKRPHNPFFRPYQPPTGSSRSA